MDVLVSEHGTDLASCQRIFDPCGWHEPRVHRAFARRVPLDCAVADLAALVTAWLSGRGAACVTATRELEWLHLAEQGTLTTSKGVPLGQGNPIALEALWIATVVRTILAAHPPLRNRTVH